MSDPDTLAVVALVVSLVALLVTVIQLLQQLYGTAEGYRRCASTVLGPWHRLRSRAWVFAEFRFETRFYTPHIELLSIDKFARNAPSGPRPLSVRLLPDFGRYSRNGHAGPSRFNDVLEKSIVSSASPEDSSRDELSEAAVTWRRLLKIVHDNHVLAWPEKPEFPLTVGASKAIELDSTEASVESTETLPAIRFKRRSWDTMPGDIVRPLATTTVGAIIVLAQRLGMTWQTVNVEDGVMLATGNGLSLSSSAVRGLGIVMRFDSVAHASTQYDVVASQASDMLICGILPGDPDLVSQNFQVFGTRRDYSYSRLEEALNLRVNELPDKTYNEVLILLCEFIPLGNCAATDISCNIFRDHGRSILHWWEGRFALLRTLQRRVQGARVTDTNFADRLQKVLTRLEELEGWRADFYLDRNNALILKRGLSGKPYRAPDAVAKRKLITVCRRIFTWTTTELTAWTNAANEERGAQNSYLDLVAAHARASRDSVSYLDEIRKTRGQEGWHQARIVPAEDMAELRKAEYSAYRWNWGGLVSGFDLVSKIARASTPASTQHRRTTVVEAYGHTERSESEKDDDIEVAWWTLMLRGIAWDMSCNNIARGGQSQKSTTTMPSSVYQSPTPVWLL